ncbi:MAG: hypothetical protein OES26_25655 [Gammaproteobacteria bacterium]|nr:hypothetical protein [Gammaproteobacteria bacterium]
MNDPHIESLVYGVEASADNISYGDPPPVEFQNSIGHFRLEDGVLTVEIAEHFADAESARYVVEQYLRSWIVQTDLTANPGQIEFKYQTANVIDRDPPPPGPGNVISAVGAASMVAVTCNATISIQCNKYPDPPSEFSTTSDVEVFHARWLQFRNGKEPLQSMAYFILDNLENRPGGRKTVAQQFGISRKILDRISVLSSRKGDALTARKSDHMEMTGQENSWLEQAVKRVILRVGEHASGAALTKLTMADLPNLD